MQWIWKFGEQYAHPPELDTDTAVTVSLDDMRHYLKTRLMYKLRANEKLNPCGNWLR